MRLRHVGAVLITASCGLVLGVASCDDDTTATTPTGVTPSGSTPTGTATGQGGSAQGGGGQGGNGSGGGCLTCFQIWIQHGDAAELCTGGSPSSYDIYNNLKTCACAACDTECGDNFCNDQSPTTQCGTCAVPACGPQTTACYQDQ